MDVSTLTKTKTDNNEVTIPESKQNGLNLLTTENISGRYQELQKSPGSKRRQIPFIDTKYTKESFQYLKVIGKGSFGKVRVFSAFMAFQINISQQN